MLSLNPQTDISNLVNFACHFNTSVNPVTSTVILSYLTTGYETLAPSNTAFAGVISNRAIYNTQVAPTLTTLYAIWRQILSLAKIYSTYGYNGDANICYPVTSGSHSYQVITAITALNNWVDAVNTNPNQILFLGNYLSSEQSSCFNAALANGFPTLSYQSPYIPMWGSVQAGTVFQDVLFGKTQTVTNAAFSKAVSSPPTIAFSSLPVISSLQLWGGEYVNQLIVNYQTSSNPVVMNHTGTDTNTESLSLNLQQGEFFTEISGYSGDFINQLTFITNRGQNTTYPPNPQATPCTFNWTASAGEVLIGFQGTEGDYVNQIQLITVQFCPATWSGQLVVPAAFPIPYPVGQLGLGFNSFLGCALPNTAITLHQSASTKTANQNFSIGLSVGGQSAKYKSSMSIKASNTAVFIVVYANSVYQNVTSSCTASGLTTAAVSLTAQQLYTAYGDSYVSNVTNGAEYWAVFVYDCETESQQQSLQNSFSVSGVVPTEPPVSIGVNFSKSVTSVTQQTHINFRAFQYLKGSS